MTKTRSTIEIDKDLAKVRSDSTTAGAAADQYEIERLGCLDSDPPDLNGAERKGASRDRELLKKEAAERRIPGLKTERASAAEREAVEAKAVARKVLQKKIDAAAAAMVDAFGGKALDRQLEALEGAAAVISEVNADRARNQGGGDWLKVEVPAAVKAAMTIEPIDPETHDLCWSWKKNFRRQGGDRKAA